MGELDRMIAEARAASRSPTAVPMSVLRGGDTGEFDNWLETEFKGAFGVEPKPRSFLSKLGQTWPAQAVKSLYEAAKLPGDVYAGRIDPSSTLAIERAADLAGGLVTGAPVARQ